MVKIYIKGGEKLDEKLEELDHIIKRKDNTEKKEVVIKNNLYDNQLNIQSNLYGGK